MLSMIYIFLSYVILINSGKLLSENPQPPLKKSTPPFLLTPSLKIQKVQVPPFWSTLKIFQTPLAERGGGHCAFPVAVISTPHFFIPNCVPMFSLNICTVCTRQSIWFLLLANNFRSSINSKWFHLNPLLPHS